MVSSKRKENSVKPSMKNNRLKQVRLRQHKTQKDVSEAIGVSDRAIAHYEKGIREPNLQTWINLADFFDVSVPYLQGITNYQGKNMNKNSFQEAVEADASKNDDGNLYFTEKDWRKFVNSVTSQESLNNFKKIYTVMNDLELPLKSFDFDEIIKHLDHLTDLNGVTEYVAYVYEIFISSIVDKDKQSIELANKIKDIVDNSSSDE